MQKKLFVIFSVLFLAAACNNQSAQIPVGQNSQVLPQANKAETPFTAPESNAREISVEIFFPQKNSQQLECNEVSGVERVIPATQEVATAAINELLKGPTDEEKAQGYTTQIPVGSKLNAFRIVNGEAQADFNAVIESGGGSCSMGIRTAQIIQTLKQFTTVKSVKISVEGRADDIFQP